MNKRMVTHLIGLGLVGLSATGWAQEQQWGAGRTVVSHGPNSPKASGMGEEWRADSTDFAELRDNLKRSGVTVAFPRPPAKLQPAEVMVVPYKAGALKEVIENYGSEFLDGKMTGYSDENNILFALNDGKVKTVLEAQGYKKDVLPILLARCMAGNFSFEIANSTPQLEDLMKTGMPDVIIGWQAIQENIILPTLNETAQKYDYRPVMLEGHLMYMKKHVQEFLFPIT